MKDLREEYDNNPYEVKGAGNLGYEEDEEDRRRRRYEEENFVRLPIDKKYAKKLKARKRKLTEQHKIDDFGEFDQIRDAFRDELEKKSSKNSFEN